jgi:spermidine synthase
MPGSGNRVIIASKEPLPDQNTLESIAPAFQQRLEIFDMDITDFPELMSTEITWDTDQRILTDQYSPANLLNN